MEQKLYEQLKAKYGYVASWAIWNDQNVRDLSLFESNLDRLRPDIVFVGLNISGEIEDQFANFHSTFNDSKFSLAINHSAFRGAYLTDIIKNHVDENSAEVMRNLTSLEERRYIEVFEQELDDLGVQNRIIIAVGGNASKILRRSKLAANHRISEITHYSHRFHGCSDPVDYARRVTNELPELKLNHRATLPNLSKP